MMAGMNTFLALVYKSTRIAFAVAFAGAVIFYAWPQALEWMLVPTLVAARMLVARLLVVLGHAAAYVSKRLSHWAWRQTANFRFEMLSRDIFQAFSYRLLPAGEYELVNDEELVEGLSFPVYRRVASWICRRPKTSRPKCWRSIVATSPPHTNYIRQF
jgi:hypothetical protein